MAFVFISHVEEDAAVAEQIADGLAAVGYQTWCYERDSFPGASYVTQIVKAIEQSNVVVIILSPDALASWQVDKEVVEAHEHGRPFVPLLRGISHAEFRERRPDWAMMLGAATSLSIPPSGVVAVLPRVVAGMKLMGIVPTEKPAAQAESHVTSRPAKEEKTGESIQLADQRAVTVADERVDKTTLERDDGQASESTTTGAAAPDGETWNERSRGKTGPVDARQSLSWLLAVPVVVAVIAIVLVVRHLQTGGPVAQATPTPTVAQVSTASAATTAQAAGTPGAPSGEGTWVVLATVPSPVALALDRDGNVYIVTGNRIEKLSAMGQVLATWGGAGAAAGQFSNPSGIAVDADGNIYVADTGNARIQKLSPTGQPMPAWGTRGRGAGQFEAPTGLALDGAGNLYVTDADGRVQKLSASGQPLTTWGGDAGGAPGQFKAPSGVAVDGDGNLYVADTGNARVQKLSAMGQSLAVWGRGTTGSVQYEGPAGIALDSQGNVYVSDTKTQRIQKLSPTGQSLAVWGSAGDGPGQFAAPVGIALDGQGNLYVIDKTNGQLQKLRGM